MTDSKPRGAESSGGYFSFRLESRPDGSQVVDPTRAVWWPDLPADWTDDMRRRWTEILGRERFARAQAAGAGSVPSPTDSGAVLVDPSGVELTTGCKCRDHIKNDVLERVYQDVLDLVPDCQLNDFGAVIGAWYAGFEECRQLVYDIIRRHYAADAWRHEPLPSSSADSTSPARP